MAAPEFIFWFGVISALSLASRRLILSTGGAVLSTGLIISVSALAAYWTERLTSDQILAVGIALLTALIVGGLHSVFVLRLGADTMLLISVVAHMVWSEFWWAVPAVTGGSGGFFWSNPATSFAVISLCAALFAAFVWEWQGQKSGSLFRAALLIHSGSASAAYGVNRAKALLYAYSIFGFITGLVGVSVTHWLRFLALETTGLSFVTSILLIALATSRLRLPEVLMICAAQALLRTTLRSVFPVSPLASHCFDIALPLLLLLVLKRPEKYVSTPNNPRKVEL